jgi:hypothetical protein
MPKRPPALILILPAFQVKVSILKQALKQYNKNLLT